ncbi:uncharacterized protein PFL1_02789 [Pseudozyma flocculosa PF-1]|uniref:Related to cyclopropane-fatty-acyl-phospholipid synthase n=2 Tax=Pseudozyma flocculosa TaxID=84751 RepID=A0A5C3F363_9BASI|nr:uncharacterized protein PFL1_02789 [Pseudozyma flocculosa PF-1]EPQ29570.1 hypothetical protein PFL1_02789 [Pseudozyma flocculosa PF-1]SPO38117.1 related to cyclopropane-fatty-acyl-phospholipid synthase [Pseudozyma flocculosa]
MSIPFPSISLPQALVKPFQGPATSIARASLLGLFSRLTIGQLEIQFLDGQTHKFGDPTLVKSKERNHSAASQSTSAQLPSKNAAQASFAAAKADAPHAVLIVKSDTFWIRMFLGADLGFAESFMTGEVDTPDLGACFELFIRNRASLSNLEGYSIASSLVSSAQAMLNRRFANTKVGSLRNIGAHYDISNEMYKAFLSKDMTYSCAIFDTLDADVTGPLLTRLNHASTQGMMTNGHTDSAASGAYEPIRFTDDLPTPPEESETKLEAEDELEVAQLRKLRMIIKRANIRKDDRVLEIGTGWGSFAMEAVRSTGCKVDSVTLSVEQKALAEARIAEAGLTGSITVHLMDYRDFPPEWTNRFDRVCSIEMLEAVGIEFLETYFSCVDRVLKRDGGVAVFQCITMPEGRFESYVRSVDFIKKWIFPGGILPSVTSLVDGATAGSKNQLVLDTVVNIGPHYSRTLREWRRRFEAHFDNVIRPALLRDHEEIRNLPEVAKDKEIEVFRRKWIYYFVYCEVGFTNRVIGDHILAFTREGNVTLPVCCG